MPLSTPVAAPPTGTRGGKPQFDGPYGCGNAVASSNCIQDAICGASTVRPENVIGVGCDAMYAQVAPGTSTGSPLSASMPCCESTSVICSVAMKPGSRLTTATS